MKWFHIITISSVISAILLASCTTAHEVKEDTEHVAKRTGHALGHGLSRAGQKLEEHTAE